MNRLRIRRASLTLAAVVSLGTAAVAAAFGQTPSAGVPNYAVPFHGKGQYISTPDGRLYYETEGAGPVVVLVAGGPGGSHAGFHPFFSRLAKDHTVVYFDNLGRGRSDRLKDPKRYTVERDADDIEALRRALGVDKISVLGHSYGGMPALAYALKYTAHTERLILSDTLRNAADWQRNIDDCNAEVAMLYPDIWAKLTAMRKSGVKTGSGQYEELYGDPTDSLYWFNAENEGRMFHSGDKADSLNFDVYLAMIGDDPEWKVGGTMKGYDPTPRMRTLPVPTLICVGRADRVATPAIALAMKNALPPASSYLIYFDRSGHRPWLEETDHYFSVVGNFLNGKPPVPGGAVAAPAP